MSAFITQGIKQYFPPEIAFNHTSLCEISVKSLLLVLGSWS